MALPPVANIVAMPIIILMTGNTMLRPDNPSSPTKLEIKIPSIMVYKDENTNIKTVGRANLIKDPNVIFLPNVCMITPPNT